MDDMTPEQLKDFLNSKALIDLVSISPDGYPHVMPIWYEWDGESFRMSTLASSKKIRNLEKNPKAAFSIATPDLPYKAVVGRGDAELSEDTDGALIKRLCYRYAPTDKAEMYYTMLMARGPRTAIKIIPPGMKSWHG